MKTLFLFLFLAPLFGLSQPAKNYHIIELWEVYLTDCNTLVPDTIKQSGKVNVKYKPVIVNGEVSHYILSPIDTVWTEIECDNYKTNKGYGLSIWGQKYEDSILIHRRYVQNTTLTSNSITYTEPLQVNNKINITRNKICQIKKRKANWDDFWGRWLVEKKIIQMN